MKQGIGFAALILLIATCASTEAEPSAAQQDATREAIFRTLFVRAAVLMPEAKVYILERDAPDYFVWPTRDSHDPDAALLSRFAGNQPRVIPVSQGGSGASDTEDYREDYKTQEHGPLLQIASLRWTSDTSADAETDIDPGLPRTSESRPYKVTFQGGQWVVQEDAARAWRQTIEDADIREAVVRHELAQGIYDRAPDKVPCYLSFGLYDASPQSDPPDSFMQRLKDARPRLQKASQRPKPESRKPWIMIGISHVEWINDDEVEVDGGGTVNQSLSAENDTYQMTRNKSGGWDIVGITMISI